jgi:hypothetical protein
MTSLTSSRREAIEGYAEALFSGCAAALSTLLNHMVTMTRENPISRWPTSSGSRGS